MVAGRRRDFTRVCYLGIFLFSVYPVIMPKSYMYAMLYNCELGKYTNNLDYNPALTNPIRGINVTRRLECKLNGCVSTYRLYISQDDA